jgi:hypothetical protein
MRTVAPFLIAAGPVLLRLPAGKVRKVLEPDRDRRATAAGPRARAGPWFAD